MKEGMKKFLFGAGLFVFISYRIFFPEALDPYLYDVCSLDYIDSKIEKKLDPTSKKSQQKLEEIKMQLLDADVASENVTSTIKASTRIVYLKKNQCVVPLEIERDFLNFFGLKAGEKNCPKDMFLEKRQNYLIKMKKTPKLFKMHHTELYQELVKQIDSLEMQRKFKREWEDPQFRDMMIVVTLQAADRAENECRNAGLPILNSVFDVFLK